jgi:dipeptidyl aminopeptidase/acylaminoacyl peptidase
MMIATRRAAYLCLFSSIVLTLHAESAGPNTRTPTAPKSVTAPQGTASTPVDIPDLLSTVRLGGAAWSPDGRQILYSGSASGRINLWIMNSDGTGAHQLLHSDDAQSGAIWSKDGQKVVYQQDRGGDEIYDLYTVAAAGGTPQNLTQTDQVSETNPHFSPDGKLLAFQHKEKQGSSINLAVMDWSTHQVRLLTHEKDPKRSWDIVTWSPDGKTLYANRGDLHEDVSAWSVDVATGDARELTAHKGDVLIGASSLSPDGKTLLIGSNEKDGYGNVALLDLATLQKRWITDTQWDAQPGSFSPAGDLFTWSLNADGRTSIQFTDAKTYQEVPRAIPEGLNYENGNPTPFAVDGRLLFVHQDSTHAPNFDVLGLHGGPAQITHVESPGLRKAVLPPTQLVHYTSFDGKIISAFLAMPFNLKRDGSNPLIVLPHGGPTGQVVDSFSPRIIALVSRGYTVIAPNVRGSTGYGVAFEKVNYQDLGGGDLQDEIYGVKFMEATGYIDPKKVGITGGSYGGFMTLMAIGKAPDIWAAAVEEYGIIDWYTMLQHSDPLLQEYEKSLLGDPVKDRSKYEAASPIQFLRKERAPLLVMQGERDIRVPREEAAQVVDILKKEGP